MKTLYIFPLLLLLCPLLIQSIFAAQPNAKKPLIIVMLGAPGAGKGTQAVKLSNALNLPQISTGDLFRENLKNQTPIGLKVKSYMEQGQLVPDQIVLDMLFDRVSKPDSQNGFILDGFPRTMPQANAFNEMIKNKAHVVAISLEVPDEMIVQRISGRFVCENCGAPYHAVTCPPQIPGICDRCQGKLIQRKDDIKEVVLERLKIYHEQTEPLKNFFKSHGCLILIDGIQPVDQISSSIMQAINNQLDQPNACVPQ